MRSDDIIIYEKTYMQDITYLDQHNYKIVLKQLNYINLHICNKCVLINTCINICPQLSNYFTSNIGRKFVKFTVRKVTRFLYLLSSGKPEYIKWGYFSFPIIQTTTLLDGEK